MQVFKKQKSVLTVLGILAIFAAVFCISASAKAIDCDDAPESPCDPPETGFCWCTDNGACNPGCYCCSQIDYCVICPWNLEPCDGPCDPPCRCNDVTCTLGPGGDCDCWDF